LGIPALWWTGTTVLTDSVEIVKYVDGKGEPLGGAGVDKALVDQWITDVAEWGKPHLPSLGDFKTADAVIA
jgi:hypothetical protein